MLHKVMERFKSGNSELIFDAPVPDFIPYACHYNPDTILTKNGELIQIIKVTGFSGEVIGAAMPKLRGVLRDAIKQYVTSNEFAMWFHTIRRKKNLDPGGHYANEFSYQLNDEWRKRNNWDKKYVNEVYISIIHSGVQSPKSNLKEIIGSLFFSHLVHSHERELELACKKLKEVVDKMLLTLGKFGSKRLSMVEEKGVYFSEQLQFFGKIVNLAEVPKEVPIDDLSHYLASHKLAFGFNTLEVKYDGAKRFAAIFTVKDYREMPSWALDQFLQLPQEFIISQTADFIPNRPALQYFKEQDYIYKVSGAKSMSEASGLSDIMARKMNQSTDFCRSQLTILFIGDTLAQLNENMEVGTASLARLGILVTRRDLRLEECFWAQLPGNFRHISRAKPLSTDRLGGFASLYNFPAGKSQGNYWGPAVTVFYTMAGTPYFFNFHVGDCGHTVILGPYGSGKTVLLNFLVSEAQKYNGRLFFFDQERASKVFIRSIGGKYTIIKPTIVSSEYAFNPFNIINRRDIPENRKYLAYWLTLVCQSHGDSVTEIEKVYLSHAIDYIASLPEEQRVLRHVAYFLDQQNQNRLVELLKPWHSQGKYAHLFDNVQQDAMSLDGMIYGFGMSFVLKEKVTLGPILSYLFYRIEMALDGMPTIIVLDEAWNLVNNDIFAPYLEQWLERLRLKNAMVIFATENVNNINKCEITQVIAGQIVTQIFMPNPKASESSNAYTQIWGLTEKEYTMLNSMEVEKRQFMLKQQRNAVIATLDLKGMKEVKVLAGSDASVEVMDKAVQQAGEMAEDWLPLFYDHFASKK